MRDGERGVMLEPDVQIVPVKATAPTPAAQPTKAIAKGTPPSSVAI